MAIWNILRTFGIFYDHLVHFVFIWYIFSGFGIMYREKSGNPDPDTLFWRKSEPRQRPPFSFKRFETKFTTVTVIFTDRFYNSRRYVISKKGRVWKGCFIFSLAWSEGTLGAETKDNSFTTLTVMKMRQLLPVVWPPRRSFRADGTLSQFFSVCVDGYLCR
jgi:hypothetical protein